MTTYFLRFLCLYSARDVLEHTMDLFAVSFNFVNSNISRCGDPHSTWSHVDVGEYRLERTESFEQGAYLLL